METAFTVFGIAVFEGLLVGGGVAFIVWLLAGKDDAESPFAALMFGLFVGLGAFLGTIAFAITLALT